MANRKFEFDTDRFQYYNDNYVKHPSKSATTGTSGAHPYNGMGRVVLKKNMVSNVNTLTQAMINTANTIYVIQYDFTLGANITVPANCVLEFNGGSIGGNGTNKNTIVFQNTALQGNPKLYDVIIEKSSIFFNSVIYADWFISDEERLLDCSSTLNMLIDYSCFLNSDVPLILLGAKNYYIKNSLIITNYGHISHLYLNGVSNSRSHEDAGTTIIVSESASNISTIVGANSSFESILNFKNISFDANNIADYSFNKSGISLSKIENCSFKNAKKICFFTENSYIFDVINCSFKGIYGKTPANYGIYMGNGTCNVVNITGCTFESLKAGIYYGNGYNLNICGCTIEGIINCGIIVAYCNGLIIDGCYFEDVAEGRNIYESTVDNVANRVGIPIRAYVGNNQYTLDDDSKTATSNSTSIYTSILLGVGLFNKEWDPFDNRFLYMRYYKNPNEEVDAFGKANAVIIKGCTHSPYVKKGDISYNTFGVMSFVTCMNVTGLNLESNNIYVLDTANLNDANVCYTLSTIVIEGHSSSRSVFVRNNRNNSNVESVGHIFFHEPNSSITYVLAASGKYNIAPETDETKFKINVSSTTYTPVEYYKGKGILQAAGTRAYTLGSPFTVQKGDSIIFEFYAKYQGGDANSMDVVINGKTFTFPLTIDFCRYNVIYTAESDFTFNNFTLGLNASALRFSPDVDVWIQ